MKWSLNPQWRRILHLLARISSDHTSFLTTLGHLGLHETRRTRGLSEIFSVFIVSNKLSGVFLERFNLCSSLWNFYMLIFFSSHTTEDWFALIFLLISRDFQLGLREEGLTPHLRETHTWDRGKLRANVCERRLQSTRQEFLKSERKAPAELQIPEHPTRNQTYNLVHIQHSSAL